MRHASGTIAQHTVKQGKHGIEFAARAGYTAKAVVYVIVGALVTMTAFGLSGGRITGTRGAIATLQAQPLGQFLLWVLVVGLAGFVAWRMYQGIADPVGKGNDVTGGAGRAGLIISGLSYAALMVYAIGRLVGSSNSSGSSSSSESAAAIMQHQGGIWAIGLLGVAFIGVAAYQAYRAYSATFSRNWKKAEMARNVRTWAERLSRFGIAARGVSFALIGWFLIQAAVQADPSEAEGLSGALQRFAGSPLGPVWLAAIGLGFLCYGLYCGINARYRRIPR